MSWFRKSISLFFEYDTPRIVHIKSKKIGILGRFLQFVILAYIIGFVLIYKKGYQEKSLVSSSITAKVKGTAYTNNLKDEELHVPRGYSNLYKRIWDPADYVFPSGGEIGGFFIMTNVVITPNQTRGECPEDPKIELAHCSNDSDCPKGKSLEVGNGVFTGKCVISTTDNKTRTCEIYAWCPVEQDILPLNGTKALLEAAENFTVLIKNAVEFPKFSSLFKRRNILEEANSSYLQECNYNQQDDPFCPVFRVGDIINAAGENFSQISIKGGIIAIQIEWYCDLDWSFMKYCRPKYQFERMDNPKAKISPGWNFRSAEYVDENRRILYKRYGIKFLVQVEGEAGKFSIIPLFLNIGSGLALMGLCTIICDWFVLYIIKNRKLYKTKKYLNVEGEDAFEISPNSPGSNEEDENDVGVYSRLDD